MILEHPKRDTGRRDTGLALLWTLLCFLAFSYHLGHLPPYHTDEEFYVQSVSNMMASGDYVTPTYDDSKRFAKPILFYWLMIFSYKLFGVSLTAARLTSVVFGSLSILVLYLLARRLFDRQSAFLSALILPGLFLHFQISRWATTDMTMSFFILLSMYFFILGYQDETRKARNYSLFYLSMSLGFLTKGPPAILIPLLTVLIFLFLIKKPGTLKHMRAGWGLLIFLFVNLPWFGTMLWLHGEEFFHHLLYVEVERRLKNESHFSFYFLGVSIRYFLPWSLFFLSAVAIYFGLAPLAQEPHTGQPSRWATLTGRIKKQWRVLREEEQHPILFCFVWFIATLGLFTLLRNQHSRYMLPASPAMALIVGHFLVRYSHFADWSQRPLFRIPFFLSLALYAVIALAGGTAILVFATTFPAPPGAVLIPLVLATGIFLLLRLYRLKKPLPLFRVLGITQIAFLALFNGDGLSYVNQYPMKTMAEEIREIQNGNETIFIYELGHNEPRLSLLIGRRVINLNFPETLDPYLNSDKEAFVIIKESEWENPFWRQHFKPVATEVRLKKIRINRETLNKFWEQGVETTLNEYQENMLLLTKR